MLLDGCVRRAGGVRFAECCSQRRRALSAAVHSAAIARNCNHAQLQVRAAASGRGPLLQLQACPSPRLSNRTLALPPRKPTVAHLALRVRTVRLGGAVESALRRGGRGRAAAGSLPPTPPELPAPAAPGELQSALSALPLAVRPPSQSNRRHLCSFRVGGASSHHHVTCRAAPCPMGLGPCGVAARRGGPLADGRQDAPA